VCSSVDASFMCLHMLLHLAQLQLPLVCVCVQRRLWGAAGYKAARADSSTHSAISPLWSDPIIHILPSGRTPLRSLSPFSARSTFHDLFSALEKVTLQRFCAYLQT